MIVIFLGRLPAVVSNSWDVCGGTIVLSYNGIGQCGNSISLPSITIDVQPAPIPTITPPALPSSIYCTDAATYFPPNATYDNGQGGDCNLSGPTDEVFVNRFFDACGGYLEVIYEADDECGRDIPKMFP